MTELLNVHEAAARLRVKPHTVYAAIYRGRLPVAARNPYRITSAALERYDRQRRRTSRHGAPMKILEPRRRLTDGQIAELRDLYAKGGLTQRELSARFNVSQQLVSNYCAGVYPPGTLSPEQIAEIRARYDDGRGGVTQAELAAEYGVSQPAVSHALRGP